MKCFTGKMVDVVDESGHLSFELSGKVFVADNELAMVTLRRLKHSVVTLVVDDADPMDPDDFCVDLSHRYIEEFASTGQPNTFRVFLGS